MNGGQDMVIYPPGHGHFTKNGKITFFLSLFLRNKSQLNNKTTTNSKTIRRTKE